MSLRESMIPKLLKTALIRPLLKKTGLDSNILKNYRPVSNLTFISKVIEKVISGRLNKHLINNSLLDPLQSAYRDKHSTETALIKVQNDILSALDTDSSAILLMLDLSVAFDTIDHNILLSRLCNVYGITGNAPDWFRSYLTGRIQSVVIEDSVSVSEYVKVPKCMQDLRSCRSNKSGGPTRVLSDLLKNVTFQKLHKNACS